METAPSTLNPRVAAEVPSVSGVSGEDLLMSTRGLGRRHRFWTGGWWKVVLLVVAVLMAHGWALRADFYMDDESHILTRETGKQVEGMDYKYRFVTGLLWDGIYGLFGASSVAFHALNLFLHLGITFSLWAVGRRVIVSLAPHTPPERASWSAFFGALIFATHPLMTEGVHYAQNASLQLVTLCTIGAVGSSTRWFASGKAGWLIGVFVCLAAAAFSKEVGLIYCGLTTALYWWAHSRAHGWASIVGGRVGRLRYGWLALIPLLGYFLWYAGTVFMSVVRAPLWAENFFTQGRLFWVYVRLLIWPSGLCADHLVPFSGVGLADPVAFASTLLLGVVVIGLLIGLWGHRSRSLCFLLLAGILPLALRCVYLNKELLVEYRAYPALPWLAIAAGCLVARLRLVAPRFTVAALAVVVAASAVASFRRSMVWSDAATLAEDTIRKYPDHLRARTHLQKLEMGAGRWERVKELRDEARDAFGRIEAFNRQSTGSRNYELSMAYRAYICSEHFYALALTETEGSKKAMEHTGEMLRLLESSIPGVLDPKAEYFEIAEQMVELDGILRHHGQEYDQGREQRQRERSLSQASQ